MRFNTFLQFFLFLYIVSIKPMELRSNDLPVDVIGNIACQMVVGAHKLEDREEFQIIEDLRTLTLVNRTWNAAMDKYAALIINALAIRQKLRFSAENAKVAAAIKLGTGGSRTWLAEQYNNEDQCEALLFNLVKPLGSWFCYDLSTVLLIRLLQHVSPMFKNVASKCSSELIELGKKYIKSPEEETSDTTSILSELMPVIVGTDEAMLQEFNHEMLWKALAHYSPIADLLKKIILKRIVAHNPHDFLNRGKYDQLDKKSHRAWCWATNNLDWDLLQEIVKYPDHMENCDGCKRTPLEMAVTNYHSGLMPVIVGIDEAMLQEFNHEMIWRAIARYSRIGNLLKKILLKRMIAYNPHDFLNRDKYDYLGKSHRTWCWAMSNLDWDLLQEIVKYPDHMENCDGCKRTPLKMAFTSYYCDYWSDLLCILLKSKNNTGNELYQGRPLIMKAIELGKKDVAIALINKPTCDINIQHEEYNYQTPLMAAIKDKWFDVVELLLERPDIDLNKKGINGHTAFELAVTLGYYEIAYKIHEAQLCIDGSQAQI